MPKRPERPNSEALREALAMPDYKSARRRETFEAYCYHTPAIDELPLLREALRHRDFVVIRAAALSIGKLGPAAKDAISDLLDATGRPDPRLGLPQAYTEGLNALINVGADPDAIIDLIHSHFGHSNWYFIKDSLHGLKRLGTPKALALLSRIVEFWWSDLDKKQKRYVQAHFPEFVHEILA
jgi:hypothetical protein